MKGSSLMQTKLYQVDPSLVEGKPLPEAFTETVFSPGGLMRRLGIEDVSRFWLAVRCGQIPPGVWMPTDEPFCVWDKSFIEEWIAEGCPVPPQILQHTAVVLKRLVDDVSDTLPDNPLKSGERN
jgi:hypothetical protein